MKIFSRCSLPFIYQHQLYEHLLQIFAYLSVKDLVSLSRVSRPFYKYVESYCEVTCKRKFILKAVISYLKEKPASETDQVIKDVLSRGEYTYKWLYITWKRVNRVYRKSMTSIWFPQENLILGKTSLRRVYKKERHISKMPVTQHKFNDVLPGTYRASIRMKINNNNIKTLQYDPASINTRWKDSYGCHEKSVQLKWGRYYYLIDYLKQSKILNINGAILTNFNPATGWFDFCFEQFVFTETSSVTFEFRDLANTWLKSGMRWNYIELRPVDWNVLL